MENVVLPESTRPANAVERLLALLVDYLFIGVMFLLTLALIFTITLLLDSVQQGVGSAYGGYVALVLLSSYSAFILIYYSQVYRPSAQTVGEKIMKIRVIPAKENRIGVRVALWRLFFLCVPLLGLISIYYGYVNKKQSFLDLLCRTVTVKEG